MFKKLMLLAGVALVAIGLGAAPAFADTHWVHWNELGEKETVETVEEEFTGFFSLEIKAAPANKFECKVHVPVHGTQNAITTVATGEVTNFEITTSTCKGAGVFAGCKLANDTNTTPWDLHVATATLDMTITEFEFVNTFEGCLSGLPGTAFKFPEITVTPDDATEIDCMVLEGEGASGTNALLITGELCAYHGGKIGIERTETGG